MLQLLEELFSWEHTIEVGYSFIYLGEVTIKSSGVKFERLKCYPLEKRIILLDNGEPFIRYQYKLHLDVV
jgi:hypothetical protein